MMIIKKIIRLIFIIDINFLLGCAKSTYLTDVNTGVKLREINIDKYIDSDTTGHSGSYYVTKIEKYKGLSIIYTSYEGKCKVILSKIEGKGDKSMKIKEHCFYKFNLTPLFNYGQFNTVKDDPQFFSYDKYLIEWDMKNITENDIYECAELKGIYFK